MTCLIESSEVWDRARPDPTTLDSVKNSWWNNVWANRGLMADPHTKSLGELFQEECQPPNGKTVVVCAGGNSLFDHRDELVDAVKRFGWDVVTVDKTRLFLVENGIIPALTISVDSDPVVKHWMVKIAHKEKIAFHFQSHPDSIKAARDGGADIYLYSDGSNESWNPFIVEQGGIRFCNVLLSCNVGTAVFWCAIRQGYSNVILLGFDYGWPRRRVIDPLFREGAIYDKKRKWWSVFAYSGGLDATRSMAKMVETTNKVVGTEGRCDGFEEPKFNLIHKAMRRVANVGGTRLDDGFKKMTFAEAVDLFGILKD